MRITFSRLVAIAAVGSLVIGMADLIGLGILLHNQSVIEDTRALAQNVQRLAFDPLVLPPQHALESTLHVGQPLHVQAVKCVTSDGPVTVSGVVGWIEVSPGSGTYGLTKGTQTRQPGCVSQTFTNAMPPAVIAESKAQFAKGATSVTWEVAGLETPTSPPGRPITWFTEQFTVVP